MLFPMRLSVCFIFIVGARLQFDCWPFELFEVQACNNSLYLVTFVWCPSCDSGIG